MSRIIKRSVTIAGHRTSISLETEFWTELQRMAKARALSVNAYIAELDATRGAHNLSSALRLAVLADLKSQTSH